MKNNTDSINRHAGASISSQAALDDMVGPQPVRRCRPYGAETKNNTTKTHGATTTIAESTTGYSSFIDNTAVRFESTKQSL